MRERFMWIIFTSIVAVGAALLAFQVNDFSVLRHAALALRMGQNPYMADDQFISPLSTLIYFLPLSFLPLDLGFRLTVFISMTIYLVLVIRSAQRRWWIVALAICTPMFLYNFFAVNVEWLIFLAVLVPPELAFMLALMKPQIGLLVAVLALIEMWRRGQWRRVIVFVLLQGYVYALSFHLGMFHAWSKFLIANYSIFPLGLIIGAPLAIYAVRHHSRIHALAAMPFCSPYVGPQSWIAVLPILAHLVVCASRHASGLLKYPPISQHASTSNPVARAAKNDASDSACDAVIRWRG